MERKPLHQLIAEFDLDNAHCFDPNEEWRLKQITGGGVRDNAAFNEQIRRLASRVEDSIKDHYLTQSIMAVRSAVRLSLSSMQIEDIEDTEAVEGIGKAGGTVAGDNGTTIATACCADLDFD